MCVTNAQRDVPVDVARLGRLTRCAVRLLRVRARGTLAVTFIGTERMRRLNRRFLRHDRPTDVLSFRYDGAPIVGEILIAPGVARAYAARHRLSYLEELGRYVVHGLLHWLGHGDRTPAQQRRMRALEDHLLARCMGNQSIVHSR
ncbi:MAG: rRNA maturation RNase YbeY [Candidatus Omnitrophota bacterium]|nr:rRNA maturation RNase YbeY [Candidatus Omnitrophota bacterium]